MFVDTPCHHVPTVALNQYDLIVVVVGCCLRFGAGLLYALFTVGAVLFLVIIVMQVVD